MDPHKIAANLVEIERVRMLGTHGLNQADHELVTRDLRGEGLLNEDGSFSALGIAVRSILEGEA